MNAIAAGRYEEGLGLLNKAAQAKPRDIRLQMDWLAQRQRLLELVFKNADEAVAAGRWDDAATLYRRALALEANNARAQQGLSAVEAGQRQDTILQDAKTRFEQGDLEGSEERLRQILVEQPKHSAARKALRQIEDTRASSDLRGPNLNTLYGGLITLEFRDTNLKMALEAISRTTGINFVLDKDVRPDIQTTIFVKNASLEDTLGLMLDANQLLKKTLNEKTVFIYPNNPSKLKEHQDLVIRSFYLTNADARKAMELIKTFVKTTDVYVDERLNLLVMRDKPEAIRVAEKLVSLQDLPDPEVMLEIAVLEIQSSRLHDLGIKFPEQVRLNVMGTGGDDSLTVEDLQHINGSRIGVSSLEATINLKRELSDGNILANPRIRARNREKAKIKIGDRVPVITTTQNTVSNSTSDSVQYLDVGLSVEVEPDIHLDDELAIRLGLEVSSVIKEVRGGGGSLAYQIGTRNVNTVLRLKDGETQVLGGLIRDDERQVDSRLPGLGDLPVAGRLFSSRHDEKQKTEIVLSITPHLVRNLDRPAANLVQFWSGTESTLNDGSSMMRNNRTAPAGNPPPPSMP